MSGDDRGCPAHRIEIEYCTQCRWLLRAAWMAQELLSTFDGEIGELVLRPGTGGVFEVSADGQPVWSRRVEGRFPDIVELKQRVRDVIAPDRRLGHADRGASGAP
ncbi:Rdx family protein [Pseudoxanthomonas sp. 10H]|uniref:SelT/SelW/SelH family protein n=1 Tax=Pseudoxanthomonas sp. 10H TaxID=3242729 RepID=UPI003555F6FD